MSGTSLEGWRSPRSDQVFGSLRVALRTPNHSFLSRSQSVRSPKSRAFHVKRGDQCRYLREYRFRMTPSSARADPGVGGAKTGGASREREDPDGRKLFDPWPDPRHAPEHKWSPNPDHYPKLKMDGGKLVPWNVRLAHVFCNNMDYGWRKRVRSMLEKNSRISFDEIAQSLNRKKTVHRPPKSESWTAESVREAYVS
jgi:hypothetical protein